MPQDPKFKKLQDKWYAKLAESGWKDAEYENGDLRAYHGNDFRRKRLQARMPDQAAYYAWATDVLNAYMFETAKEKQIWALHADGLSVREIGRIVGLSRQTVLNRLKKVKGTL